MVVDNLPAHYYKAEVLLQSLVKLAGLKPGQILVNCVDRVSPEFKTFVTSGGYRQRDIAPFLDGKYCNKLQQLEDLDLGEAPGVWLLDIDTVVLHELIPPASASVCGKVVDAPNPPVSVLHRIFAAAGIAQPKTMSSDWASGDTFDGNFNGGVLFIPSRIAATVSTRWRQWASWLYDRPELFDTPSQRIHVDQVSLAMALVDGLIPHQQLAANQNFPAHESKLPRTFKADEPVALIHYHQGISHFGLIEAAAGVPYEVIRALERANHLLSSTTSYFWHAFKCSRAVFVGKGGAEFPLLRETIGALNLGERKLRLILHAGTPKTGTSSLQSFLYSHHATLHERGILYPAPDQGDKMPKHQWLVSNLLAGDEAAFCTGIRQAFTAAEPHTHTVVLSTEGIYNHWWDFPERSRQMLLELTRHFDLHLWVWFRSSDSFASSLYRQCLANPRAPIGPCYGLDHSFDEMLADTWFVRHLDYLGFLEEAASIFGRENVHPFPYRSDVVENCKALLGVTSLPPANTRENLSLGRIGVDLVRVLNRYGVDGVVKDVATALIKQIESNLGEEYQPYELSCSERNSVAALTARNEEVLRGKWGVSWA